MELGSKQTLQFWDRK